MNDKALTTIISQIKAASGDLKVYQPQEMNWTARSIASAERLIPWLSSIAVGLKNYSEEVLNAPAQLRRMWPEIRKKVSLPKEQIESFERQLSLDDVLRESVTGETVSKVVTKYLLDNFPKGALKSNGRSDYPDIYLGDLDYSQMPTFQRLKNPKDQYGAAIKGGRPVRVPDGLEIKTCRDRIAVDCHHPHPGLHLVLLFGETDHLFTVDDLRVAFLRQSDYRESERNTTATTVKYSFNGDKFVSLLA